MTKQRAPLTIDAALTRIAAQLPGSWDEMAEITGRRRGTVRSWADPDRREQIPLRDAALLDEAYCAAGGTGAPLHAWYAARLHKCGALTPPSQAARLSQIAAAIRECAEATAAMLEAAQPGAGHQAQAVALRELDEAIAELHRLRPSFERPSLHAVSGDPLTASAGTHPATGPPR